MVKDPWLMAPLRSHIASWGWSGLKCASKLPLSPRPPPPPPSLHTNIHKPHRCRCLLWTRWLWNELNTWRDWICVCVDIHNFPDDASGKEPACQCRRHKRPGSIPGSARSPEGWYGNPLQYSCPENAMDRAACWPTVHRVAQSQTQLKQLSVHSRVTYRDCVCVCVCVCVWWWWEEAIPSGGNCLNQGLEASEYPWCSVLKVIYSVCVGRRALSGSLRNLDFIL